MADMVTTLATVKAVADGVDEAAKLAEWVKKQGWAGRLADLLKKRHHFIVLGPTGVGKTNLVESLRSNLPVDIDRLHRTLDATAKPLKVDDKILQFVDVPGEIAKQDIRLDTIRRSYSGKICGILNVVAYGYHEHSSGTSRDALTLENKPRQQWLMQHRNMELTATKEWVKEFAHLRAAKGLITVINKADLWWNDGAKVSAYYSDEKGDYRESLGPAAVLPHDVIHYCCLIKKYWDEANTSGSFDDLDRAKARHTLLRVLLTVAARC